MARYKIKSIERTMPPEGATGLNWYKFIIENDKNTITNLRAGSKKEVQNFARESIKRLNEKYFTHVYFKNYRPAIYEVEVTNHIY